MEQLPPQDPREAAAAPMPGANIMLPPQFIEDPAAFLNHIAMQPPSSQGVAALAGPIAKWFVSAAPKQVIDAEPQALPDGVAIPLINPAVHVSSHYLRAAAVQLRENSHIAGNLEQEMAKTKNQYEVLEAVGVAASLCPTRAGVASTGIIPTLAHVMLQQAASDAAPPAAAAASAKQPSLDGGGGGGTSILAHSAANYPTLQQAGVEFLQCALVAEHYRYAARLVQGTWPRPNNTVNVKTVLRYYYLRGLIHEGCGDHVMAHRCWWTCLSVPADACSSIMVAAWKKLALVQPMLDRTRGVANVHYPINQSKATENISTRFPKSTTKALGRLLTTAKEQKDAAILLYTQLGPAVEMCKPDAVLSLIQTHEGVLRCDGNYGLAQQCLQRVRNNQVYEASQLFSTVSVAQLAQRLSIAPEQVPQRLMDSKVPCHVEEDGMVVFAASAPSHDSSGLPPPSNHHDPSMWVDLSEWMQLLERLQHLEMSITTSSKYHAYKEMDKGGSGGGKSEAMGPRGVEDF